MDTDTTISSDKVLELTDLLATNLNTLLKKLKGVFLVEDFVESLKFAVGKFKNHWSHIVMAKNEIIAINTAKSIQTFHISSFSNVFVDVRRPND